MVYRPWGDQSKGSAPLLCCLLFIIWCYLCVLIKTPVYKQYIARNIRYNISFKSVWSQYKWHICHLVVILGTAVIKSTNKLLLCFCFFLFNYCLHFEFLVFPFLFIPLRCFFHSCTAVSTWILDLKTDKDDKHWT